MNLRLLLQAIVVDLPPSTLNFSYALISNMVCCSSAGPAKLGRPKGGAAAHNIESLIRLAFYFEKSKRRGVNDENQ
jgi:hypothetical protein